MAITFSGAVFTVESATQTGPSSFRVKFTQDPKKVDRGASNDGLNSANYTLTGPSSNTVIKVVIAPDDPQAVDCYSAFQLGVGTWAVTVANVVEDTLVALTTPFSRTFTVTQLGPQGSLSNGAENDEAFDVIRKFLNPGLKGPGWDSIIAGLAAGVGPEWENARLAFDQLFLSTASGSYLAKRASDVGLSEPAGVALSDALFRKLAVVSKTRKLTQEAILEVLEVFYGEDAVRASVTTDVAEPYLLANQDDLTVMVDEKLSVIVNFQRAHFAQIGVASALEVATEITRALRSAGSQAFAESFTDPSTGLDYVRIYSGSLGLSSSLRIVGGRAQTQLLFPKSIYTTSGSSPFAVWSVDLSPTTIGNVRFTETSGIYDLFQLQQGDLAYIYGPEFAASGCTGSFRVEQVSVTYSGVTKVQWFEIANPLGVGVGAVTQTLFQDLMLFRPVKRTIYDHSRHVIVTQSGSEIDVVIPATTQAVSRTPSDGAYLKAQDEVDITSAIRTPDGTVTVSTTTPHGLQIGQSVFVDDMEPTGASAPVEVGTPSGDFSGNVATGTTNDSLATTASGAQTFQGVNHRAIRTEEGLLMLLGGFSVVAGVPTPLANPVILEITNETVGSTGGRLQTYKWTNLVTRSYNVGRRAFGMSLCELNGKILVTGGTDGDDLTGTPKNNWDFYTYTNAPPQNSQTTGTMPVARVAHAQCSLGVFGEMVAGGWTTPGTAIATVYLFDTTTATWTAKAPMNRARMYIEAAVLSGFGGAALVMGGQVGNEALSSCEIYDSNADTWSYTSPMSFGRYRYGVVQIPDGRVVVIGGKGYNPTQPDSFTPTHLGRNAAGAVTLTGAVLGAKVIAVQNLTTPGDVTSSFESTISVVNQIQQTSGSDLSAQTLKFFIRQANDLVSCEIYDPETQLWSNLPSMSVARSNPVVAYIPTQNVIMVAGGQTGSTVVEIFDVATFKWRKSLSALAYGLANSAGGLVGIDTFAVTGGIVVS